MNALIFIIKAVAHLYVFVLLLRFWLPVVRADFRNPIAQAVLKLSSPLIIPLRRVLPPIGRLDTATIIVTFAVEYLLVLVVFTLRNYNLDVAVIAVTALVQLLVLSLQLFTFAILIKVIMSWIAPHTYNPATALISSLVEPLLRPFRSLIPGLGGFDISPMIVIILLQATVILISDFWPITF